MLYRVYYATKIYVKKISNYNALPIVSSSTTSSVGSEGVGSGGAVEGAGMLAVLLAAVRLTNKLAKKFWSTSCCEGPVPVPGVELGRRWLEVNVGDRIGVPFDGTGARDDNGGCPALVSCQRIVCR